MSLRALALKADPRAAHLDVVVRILNECVVSGPHGITFTDVKTFSCADRDQGYPCLFPIPALKDLWSLRLPHIAAIDPE